MEQDILKEYAEVCATEKEIAARKKELSKIIVEQYGEELKNNPELGKKDFGTFKMFPYSNPYGWKFSAALTSKMEEIEMDKQDEKEQGIATPPEPVMQLRFNAPRAK